MASPFEMQEQPQASGPVGGLADKALGGLTKFMTNVNRGVERVLSNPLYERAWSGMVSGMYGDPMAGPLAVQQLRQNAMSQEIQRREMKAMEESPTQRAIRESEENARLYRMRLDERLRNTPMSDPNYREAWAARYPLAYGKQAFAAPKAGARPVQAMVDGKPQWVMPDQAVGLPPVPNAPLVSIGGEGLNPYQTSQTRSHYISEHQKESEPYIAMAQRLAELDRLLGTIDGEPDAFQSEAAATAFGKGLKPNEAVMRDDIARILGQGFENQLRGWANLPQKASRAQIQQMRDALATIVEVARYRQQSIDEKYRSLGSDYQVDIPTYTPAPRSVPGGSDPRFPEIE